MFTKFSGSNPGSIGSKIDFFNKDIAFRISENKVEKDKRLTVSTFVRDKYGFESYKHCIYEFFELINNPNE